ncbi:hypothetical protein NXS19_011684 [Fusarium pseudograminearum]|nr:hypothetical protein NXS19_011684 [Fusarium pseudograminearum]
MAIRSAWWKSLEPGPGPWLPVVEPPLRLSKAQGHVWWLKVSIVIAQASIQTSHSDTPVCYIRPAPDHTHTLGLGAASQNIISRLFWDSCWQHLSPLTTSLPPVNTIPTLPVQV